jgi:hypothetical protein
VYESNGPDVKVRGTAQTVADKYLQLARDAVSAGDIVMSESYFQHAEHYMRIIAASQSQQQQQQQLRAQEAGGLDDDDDEVDAPGTGPQPSEVVAGAQSRGNESRSRKSNGASATDSDEQPPASFDGDLPQFLKTPVEEPVVAEKPKRARKSPSRSKVSDPAAASNGDGEAVASCAPASDSGEETSDAEVAVG